MKWLLGKCFENRRETLGDYFLVQQVFLHSAVKFSYIDKLREKKQGEENEDTEEGHLSSQ